MAGLARRRPLRSRKVWTATENRSRRAITAGGWRELREQCAARAGGRCQAEVPGVCEGRGGHAHHILRRSQGGPDSLDNLAWLCAACHGYVHDRIDWSMRRGLLRPKFSFDAPPWMPGDRLSACASWAASHAGEDPT